MLSCSPSNVPVAVSGASDGAIDGAHESALTDGAQEDGAFGGSTVGIGFGAHTGFGAHDFFFAGAHDFFTGFGSGGTHGARRTGDGFRVVGDGGGFTFGGGGVGSTFGGLGGGEQAFFFGAHDLFGGSQVGMLHGFGFGFDSRAFVAVFTTDFVLTDLTDLPRPFSLTVFDFILTDFFISGVVTSVDSELFPIDPVSIVVSIDPSGAIDTGCTLSLGGHDDRFMRTVFDFFL